MSHSLWAMFMSGFYIYKMFIEWAKLFGKELNRRTAVSLATEVSLYLNFLLEGWENWRNLNFSSYRQLQYIEYLCSVQSETPNELYYLIMLVAVSFYLSISLKSLPKGSLEEQCKNIWYRECVSAKLWGNISLSKILALKGKF